MPASIRPAPRALCSSLAKAIPVPGRAEAGPHSSRSRWLGGALVRPPRKSRAGGYADRAPGPRAREQCDFSDSSGPRPGLELPRLEPPRRDPPPRRFSCTTCSALMQQAAAMAEAPPWSCVFNPHGSRQCGAVEKTRTSTAFRPQRPQRCASTNSATTALVNTPVIDRRLARRGRLAKRSGARNGADAPRMLERARLKRLCAGQ